jgi:hypothetical protein
VEPRPRARFHPGGHSPNLVEGLICELRPEGVLGSPRWPGPDAPGASPHDGSRRRHAPSRAAHGPLPNRCETVTGSLRWPVTLPQEGGEARAPRGAEHGRGGVGASEGARGRPGRPIRRAARSRSRPCEVHRSGTEEAQATARRARRPRVFGGVEGMHNAPGAAQGALPRERATEEALRTLLAASKASESRTPRAGGDVPPGTRAPR